MSQVEPSGDRSSSYAGLGDEVAFVLASARDAAAEMREQAKHYSEALLAGARQEIQELLSAARSDAAKITETAQDEAERLLTSARRQVLNIIEAAQTRVDDAERAAADAAQRRDEMLRAEADLENGVTQVISALSSEVERLRSRREALRPPEGEKTPKEELGDLLAASAAALIETETSSNGNGTSEDWPPQDQH